MIAFYHKVIVITGAASGIGKALAMHFAYSQANLVLADINTTELGKVTQELNAIGGNVVCYTADVSKVEDIKGLIQFAVSRHSEIDFFFNNAGISIDGELRDMTYDLWRKILNINLWGVIYGTTEVYNQMLKQKHGHIVNISSLAGLMPGWMQVAYSTTKWAILGFSISLRAEAIGLGVKISTVCPGIVDTNIFSNTTLLNVKRDDFMANLAFKPYDVSKAALKIAKGVFRNQSLIIFPFHARFLYFLYKFFPGVMLFIGKNDSVKFRKMRKSE